DQAAAFDPTHPGQAGAIESLKRRCRQAMEGAHDEVSAHIDALARAWCSEIERCRQANRALHYSVPDSDTGSDRLLFNHQDRIRGLWPTLQSLRNVENTAWLKVL